MTSFPKHLVSMDQLDRVMIESIIEKALAFIDKQSWQIKQNRCLAHKTVVNMFFSSLIFLQKYDDSIHQSPKVH